MYGTLMYINNNSLFQLLAKKKELDLQLSYLHSFLSLYIVIFYLFKLIGLQNEKSYTTLMYIKVHI